MKAIKFFILLLVFAVSSCAIYPTVSRFAREPVRLGMTKSEVVAKMGTPFRTDTYMEGDKHIDVLYYKENLRVGVTPYDVIIIYQSFVIPSFRFSFQIVCFLIIIRRDRDQRVGFMLNKSLVLCFC